MKNAIIVLYCCMLFNEQLFSQNFNIEWGTLSQNGGINAWYLPIGLHDNNFYTIQFNHVEAELIKVDSGNNIVKQTPLLVLDKKVEAELIFPLDNQINVLHTDYEEDKKRLSIFNTSFDYNGELLTTKPTILASFAVTKKNETSPVIYKFSQDSSKLLMFMVHNGPPNDNARFTACVINTLDQSIMWQETFDVAYDKVDFNFLSWAVDSVGNVVTLAVIAGGEGKRLLEYSTRILSIDAITKKIADKEFKIDGKFLSSAYIRFVNNNNLIITGFYNDLNTQGRNRGIEGVFTCITDIHSLNYLNLKLQELSEATRASITRSGAFESLNKLNSYVVQDLKIQPDGSGYVIAEYQEIREKSQSNGNHTTYDFNHIIIYHFNTNKEISYITAIPKLQSTVFISPILTGPIIRLGIKYNSFISYENSGNVYILYNDHQDNGDARTMDDAKVMLNSEKANAVVVTVDSNGNWEKKALFNGKDVDVILVPNSSMPIPNEGFFISCERKKDVQFARIKIE